MLGGLLGLCILADEQSKRVSSEEEVEELQQRIEKAIEYINNSQRWLCKLDNEYYETIAKDKLLEILKGSDK